MSENQLRKLVKKNLSKSLSKRELDELEGTLDFALEMVIYGDKYGLFCDESEKQIADAVKEEGEFWEACQHQAWKDLNFMEVTNFSVKLLLKLNAVEIGRTSLIEAYLKNYPYLS